MPQVQYLEITEPEAGQKLLPFLQKRLAKDIPRSALLRWIRTGQVRLDKRRCKPFQRLQAGQQVRIPPHTGAVQQARQEKSLGPAELNFIYEDDHIAVLNKPGGLAVQPGSKQQDSIHSRLCKHYASYTWFPTPAHRLDKDTSGLLLIAKSHFILGYVHELWREHKITKIYLAWVQGRVNSPDWLKLEDRLQKVKTDRGREIIQASTNGQTAITHIKTLVERNNASLIALNLQTGRKHQIRVQLASRGHPVLGDLKYGDKKNAQGLLLHAWHLSWEEYSFTLPPAWTKNFAVTDRVMGICAFVPIL